MRVGDFTCPSKVLLRCTGFLTMFSVIRYLQKKFHNLYLGKNRNVQLRRTYYNKVKAVLTKDNIRSGGHEYKRNIKMRVNEIEVCLCEND